MQRFKGSSLGSAADDVDAALSSLRNGDVIARLWRGDHTIWRDDPTEITNRLGWLNVTDQMSGQVADLESLAADVRDAGFKDVVLLGMGGSSLGPEVLRQALGSAPGFPKLTVLDSTVPNWVRKVTDSIDPASTLFLVSSKSGTTAEPNMFYLYFRERVDQAVGSDKAGAHFVAVTDPDSQLARLGERDGFRRVFLNPKEIGGRYSILSYFGLVPAALAGLDLAKLIASADSLRAQCAPGPDPSENPGAWLGAVMGALAPKGRDKLTLVTSPSLSGFGLWVEQLLAESTGKLGNGIVPIAGEPLVQPEFYGDDRLFVQLRLDGDDNTEIDSAIDALQSAGHPVIRLEMREMYDLGAEFYRWEFATAVAGSILGINPFDQPDVESAKILTNGKLAEFESKGTAPELGPHRTLGALLSDAKPGDYLAIMAYVNETNETNAVLNGLRRAVMKRYRIATTLGYGPRFLHSTGQLHKGGPGNGLFLQITQERSDDLPIPGKLYTFGILADAQASGDFDALEQANRKTARIHLIGDLSEISISD